ncbi:hypothetical protein BDQ12DRAFT_679825 [Crucibulum laeve]|uniref:Uncharacterized protein n=1 Tax=Crucibulum laeve TaxID=68775 RepID=A0A5C3M5G9_9AGAR|nr:hypothetical protein BDQ12DRAFT_679825 [Crucibulum laeve]
MHNTLLLWRVRIFGNDTRRQSYRFVATVVFFLSWHIGAVNMRRFLPLARFSLMNGNFTP